MGINTLTAQTLEASLLAGTHALRLRLTQQQQQQLLQYLALIQKWNQVYNVTALQQPSDLLRLHILDSLAVAAVLQKWQYFPKILLDAGSGAGLPGVVLAVVFPQTTVICVDAVAKKTSFIQQVRTVLQLPNLEVQHTRVEQLPEGVAACAISRAFATLRDFVRLTNKALCPGGVWLAMKGRLPTSEIQALAINQSSDEAITTVFHVEPLQIPGIAAQRHLLSLYRRSEIESVHKNWPHLPAGAKYP